MNQQAMKRSAFNAWGTGARGYVKKCRECGVAIYLHQGDDGKWRPFESWAAGNAEKGEFVPHHCA